jgi:hypothetical protein
MHVNGTALNSNVAAVKVSLIFCAFDYYKSKGPRFGWALCQKCLLACSMLPTFNTACMKTKPF